MSNYEKAYIRSILGIALIIVGSFLSAKKSYWFLIMTFLGLFIQSGWMFDWDKEHDGRH